MTTPPDTVASLQAELRRVLHGLHHPPLGALAALTEETGEAAKHLVDHHCYGKPFDGAAFGDELADIFICISELATLHDVDLAAAIRRKIDRVATLAPGWRTSLGASLGASWRQVHGPGARQPETP